jgi:ubiquinone/menaquinone biosynthesis C-methylase UbiE
VDGPTRQIDGLLALVEADICLANRSGVEPGWLVVGVEDDGRITGSRSSPPCAAYVHGYHPRENTRLQDQASTLEELLHSDTHFPPGSRILEAGCGVGAQTVPLARNSPHSLITAVDISEASAGEARRRVAAAGLTNVQVLQGDIFNLPFQKGSFDHLFICFVLEHLSRPVEALSILMDFVKPGGTITAIEGDHGSAYFYPDSEAAHRAISCQVELQKRAGGNAMIGRELYPLLCQAGFSEVSVSPRMVYVDSSKPELVEGFTRRTFTAMIEGVHETAVEAGIIEQGDFETGIKDLYRTTAQDGVFCYTFFKATGRKI